MRLSEIRVGTPVDPEAGEFVELAGNPDASLDGLTFIVVADTPTALSGVVVEATPLDGFSLDGNGLFVIAEPGVAPAADLVTTLFLEDDRNTTYLLVRSFTGQIDDDLDPDDVGGLDITPWDHVQDLVASILEENPPVTTGFHYGYPTIGPAGDGSAPGHIYACAENGGEWLIGASTFGVDDTPGLPNPCPSGACCLAEECLEGMAPFACGYHNGSYQGDDSTCAETTCPVPTGACCLPDYSCLIMEEINCGAFGGSCGGDLVSCSTVDCGPPPPPVPSGDAGEGMRVERLDTAGTQLEIHFEESCDGVVDHHIVFGGGSDFPDANGVFTLAGTVCDIGLFSPYAWEDVPDTSFGPSGLLWWLVIADDNSSVEGSWGTDSDGNERWGPVDGATGECGVTTRDVSNTCGL